MEPSMKIQRYSSLAVLLIAFWATPKPAWGVSKEMIQLQTQVQALQDQMTQDAAVVQRAHGRDEEPDGSEHRQHE